MKRKKIKLLTAYCYDNHKLNKKKVFNITRYLKRDDLKKFIKELKDYEAKRSVTITLSLPNYNQSFFKNYFPDKNIVLKYDPNLLAGIKIEYDDNIYEFNLKNTLEKESLFVRNYYD